MFIYEFCEVIPPPDRYTLKLSLLGTLFRADASSPDLDRDDPATLREESRFFLGRPTLRFEVVGGASGF
jgi:hypothetical protein